jgi:2-C-methyl-D-erythritol 2,4-cyclodiphosphate synthase
MAIRIGFGIDFHQLAEGRPFWLGGVLIPSTRGAVGHSDADVLIHAICDALLGALALGDIGQHFPNTDPAYKDIDSKILLAKSFELIKARGWRVVNIDSTVTLEAPKIMKHAPAMRCDLRSQTCSASAWTTSPSRRLRRNKWDSSAAAKGSWRTRWRCWKKVKNNNW